MAKKSLYPLTEPMYYVLMCFHRGEKCGTEIAEYVRTLTGDRVHLGPGTLYTILSTFQCDRLSLGCFYCLVSMVIGGK